MRELAPKRSRRETGRWLSAAGIRERQEPEKTNAKSFLGWDSTERESPGLRCLTCGLEGRRDFIFPGGKWACEHQVGTDLGAA